MFAVKLDKPRRLHRPRRAARRAAAQPLRKKLRDARRSTIGRACGLGRRGARRRRRAGRRDRLGRLERRAGRCIGLGYLRGAAAAVRTAGRRSTSICGASASPLRRGTGGPRRLPRVGLPHPLSAGVAAKLVHRWVDNIVCGCDRRHEPSYSPLGEAPGASTERSRSMAGASQPARKKVECRPQARCGSTKQRQGVFR